MTKVVSAVVVLSLVGVCRAQPTAEMSLRLSRDGVTWHETLVASPGTTVHCGWFIGFAGAYGVFSTRCNILGDGLAEGDTIAGVGHARVPPFTFGAGTEAVYRTGSAFRIDAARDPANSRNSGIVPAQTSPPNLGTNFCTDNPALVYRFDIVLGPDSTLRTITLITPANQLPLGGLPVCPDLDRGCVAVFNNNHSGAYTNVCIGSESTHAANLTVACNADFNLDGFVDFFDASDFIDCFDRENCPAGRTADIDHNDFVSFFDFNAFVDAYEAGC